MMLTEAWKKAYSEYLKEEEAKLDSDLDNLMITLAEAHEETKRGFVALENYFKLFSNEVLNEEAEVGTYTRDENGVITFKKDDARNTDNSDLKGQQSDSLDKDILGTLKELIKINSSSDNAKKDLYTPSVVSVKQDMSSLKFPANLIFFIKQIAKWIKNVILYFIESIKNIIRKLLGDTKSVTELDPEALKLDLKTAKKLETVQSQYSYNKKNGIINAVVVKDEKINLAEGLFDSVIKKPEPAPGKNDRVIVTVDLSKDIESLSLLVNHFYELFDNAFGSFNEKLFEVDDLKMIFNIFDSTYKRIKDGTPATEVNIGGSAMEFQAVNSSVVRQNLIYTNENIEKIKNAYLSTTAKIKDIAKIINNKELLMLTDLGVSYKMLTYSTLKRIEPILRTIPVRMKAAAKLEKDLERTKKAYEELVSKLAKSERSFVSVSNITYDSTYARSLDDLFVSARYMSDIVTLRLSGVVLYIKELKELKDILAQVVGIQKRL